jgi:hypothetical protein
VSAGTSAAEPGPASRASTPQALPDRPSREDSRISQQSGRFCHDCRLPRPAGPVNSRTGTAIAQALPDSWRNPVTEFWPTQAGGQLASVHPAAHTLQPWPGFGVMCLFVAIVYAIAWTLLDRRDA